MTEKGVENACVKVCETGEYELPDGKSLTLERQNSRGGDAVVLRCENTDSHLAIREAETNELIDCCVDENCPGCVTFLEEDGPQTYLVSIA